jgi:hypothetical protein
MTMGKKNQGKRGLWATEALEQTLKAIEAGRSQREAAAQFKISRRTLRNHIKSGSAVKQMGRNSVLTVEQERDLVQRIIRFNDVGMPLSTSMLRSYVYQFCEKNEISTPFNAQKGMAGKDWLKAFLKRNRDIAQRRAQHMNPARAQKLNRFIVSDYFNKLEKVLTEMELFDKPDRIFNIDEKGCQLAVHHQQKVLAKTGSKRVHLVAPEHGENVTIVACGNAMGNVIPPMIIFKGKRRNDGLGDDLPPGSAVEMAPKGSMTTEIFIRWLKHFAKYKPAGDVLLVFDGAASHLNPDIVDEADKHGIKLFCLPSNTTHELQPLDKSCFRAFESYWDDEVLKFWRQHPDRVLTKARFGKIFTPVWMKTMTMTTLVNGFKATGLFPFDRHAIPDTAYAPSDITFQEQSG